VARIHPDILKKLAARLGVRDTRVYELIAAKAGETHLPRHLAALVLAAEQGININKRAYATVDERALMRAPAARPVAPPQAASPRAPGARRQPRSPAKGDAAARKSDSVMVVYGRDPKARDAMFTFLRAIGIQTIE